METLFVLLLVGYTHGSTANTMLPEYDLWLKSSMGVDYWDLNDNGMIDVADLVYYRDVWFEDVALSVGIDASHHAVGDYFGIGQAWGDYSSRIILR